MIGLLFLIWVANVVDIVFLDLRKAFNSVPHK